MGRKKKYGNNGMRNLEEAKTNTTMSVKKYNRKWQEREKNAKLELKLKWREGDGGGDLQQ